MSTQLRKAEQFHPPLTAPVERVAVNPETAQEWITERMYEGQRALRARHVEFLAGLMRRGAFRGGRITFAVFEGRYYLVNGHHTLNAIVRSDSTITCTVEYEEVGSYEEVGVLYGTFDHQMTRTDADAFSAIGLGAEIQMTSTDLNRFSAGVKALNAGFKQPNAKIGLDELEALMREWQAEGREYLSLVAGADGRDRHTFCRAGVWAVALVTLRHAPDRAAEFWRQVCLDDGLRKNDPRKTLSDTLSRTFITGGSPTRSHTKVVTEDVTRMCVLAWNAYMRNEDLQLIKFRMSGRLAIAGTPHYIAKSAKAVKKAEARPAPARGEVTDYELVTEAISEGATTWDEILDVYKRATKKTPDQAEDDLGNLLGEMVEDKSVVMVRQDDSRVYRLPVTA